MQEQGLAPIGGVEPRAYKPWCPQHRSMRNVNTLNPGVESPPPGKPSAGKALHGQALHGQANSGKPSTGKPSTGKPETTNGHFEAKTDRFEAKIDHFEAKIDHFEAKTDHFKLKSTILKLKPAILKLKSTILKQQTDHLEACLKNTSEVGILGLALNPKRWTIGRLTSKAGEGRENKKGLPRTQRPNNNIHQKPLRS